MRQADPHRLAMAASNMFVDMLHGTDSRFGYVVFSDIISRSHRLMPNDESELLKSEITRIGTPQGWTDIALGLERALLYLREDSLNGRSHRRPVIILLSDGNTEMSTQRLTNESLQRLDAVTEELRTAGVPVYTVGLNWDNMLRPDEVDHIADRTGALSQIIETADELAEVMQTIFEDLLDLPEGYSFIFPAVGGPQSVPFTIPDNSIYRMNVSITGRYTISGVSLTAPDGTIHGGQGGGHVVILNDSASQYALMILNYPAAGEWLLNFTGTEGDRILFNRRYIRDLNLVMGFPATSFGQAEISWHIEDSSGNAHNDPILFDRAAVTLRLNGGALVLPFPEGQMSAAFELDPGSYTAVLTLETQGGILLESNPVSFTVPDCPPVRLRSPLADVMEAALTTLFRTETTLDLDGFVSKDASCGGVLDVQFLPGDWQEYITLQYDPVSRTLHVEALKSGRAEAGIVVSDAHGNSVTLFLDANVRSGWLYVIIAGAALLLILLIVFIILLSGRPYLDTALREIPIQASLPDNQVQNTPPEAVLRLEHTKAKRTLRQIIDYNREHSYQYNAAFENIGWFTGGMVFAPKKTAVEVTVPTHGMFVMKIDGRRQNGVCKTQLTRGSRLTIELAHEEDIYQIVLGGGGYGAPGPDWNDPFLVDGNRNAGGGFDSGFDF
jgi:hypothetical protein